MTEAPTSFQAMLCLVLAVWLLAGSAYLCGLPSNIAAAMLILGTTAAVTEWFVTNEPRDGRRMESTAPVYQRGKKFPSEKSR
jgi:hypothetical protein